MKKIAIIGAGSGSLILTAIAGAILSCNSKTVQQSPPAVEVLDSVKLEKNYDPLLYELRSQDSLQIVTLNEQLTEVAVQLNAAVYENEDLKKQITVLKARNDSIHESAFLARYKLERVRYYLNICLRNPSQDKFLKGWVRRAVE